jgi:GNAT superfamily N-acetyltransferase
MKIRRAILTDAAEIASLLSELGYPASAGAVAARLDPLLPRDDYAVLVAQGDSVVVGLGAVHVFPVIHADGPVALITALVVAGAARGGGIGRGLVAEMEGFARSQGCARILVTTANHRADAHAFYERLGYSFTGRRYAKQPL